MLQSVVQYSTIWYYMVLYSTVQYNTLTKSSHIHFKVSNNQLEEGGGLFQVCRRSGGLHHVRKKSNGLAVLVANTVALFFRTQYIYNLWTMISS